MYSHGITTLLKFLTAPLKLQFLMEKSDFLQCLSFQQNNYFQLLSISDIPPFPPLELSCRTFFPCLQSILPKVVAILQPVQR